MDNNNEITLNEKNLEVLVAKFIPTSQYFERSFEMLQKQIDGLHEGQAEIKRDIERRFEQVDKRFEQVNEAQAEMKRDMDKRFEQVDKRFEQVDKRFDQVDQRFEQIIGSIDRLAEKLDNRDKEHRLFTMRMFSISIMISFLGVLGVFLKMFQVV